MENVRERNFGIVDSYCGLEAIDPTVRAGTEELDFFSETGTYNRDNEPCINFSISEEFLSSIDALINNMQNRKRTNKA